MRSYTISATVSRDIKLWLASPHFYPTYGGAQNRYRSYIPGFLERGLDVHIMTGTPLKAERSESDPNACWYEAQTGSWLPATTLDGAPLERIRLPDTKQRARTKIYYDALLEVCSRPTPNPVVAQLLTNLRPEARPWLRKLRDSGVATLYSISQYPKWPRKRIKRIFRKPAYRDVFNEFDALVTNSEAIVEFLQDMGVTTRLEYIPNGVNLARFQPANSEELLAQRSELRAQLGIPEGHRVIVTVGAVMPRKGPAHIIRGWRKILQEFPDTHLLFVGPRADLHDDKLQSFGAKIAREIASSGAANQVHFTGVVDDVQNYLRASDVFILASEREGTPNSVLEAMASGLPCLVTPYTGISNGIGQANRDYILVERSPEAIALKLGELLREPGALAAQAERGQRFVLKHADQQISLDRYADLYRELGKAALVRR